MGRSLAEIGVRFGSYIRAEFLGKPHLIVRAAQGQEMAKSIDDMARHYVSAAYKHDEETALKGIDSARIFTERATRGGNLTEEAGYIVDDDMLATLRQGRHPDYAEQMMPVPEYVVHATTLFAQATLLDPELQRTQTIFELDPEHPSAIAYQKLAELVDG